MNTDGLEKFEDIERVIRSCKLKNDWLNNLLRPKDWLYNLLRPKDWLYNLLRPKEEKWWKDKQWSTKYHTVN